MKYEELKRLGPIIFVIYFAVMIVLRNTEYVLMKNVINYIFMAIFLIFFVLLFVNRYR